MSDIIPPLIPSTPPPMPEFDDDEDDDEDDDDFGMGAGIGDLGLDYQDAGRENKDKILELERSVRVGSNGSQDGWRSNEEQDSASQDSGLCMASHGSEGVSPLPQSDDDERGENSGGSGEMKHSATVVFDANAVPVPDTGQNAAPTSDSSAANEATNEEANDEDRSDDEFGNWTVAADSGGFQFDSIASNDLTKESKDQPCNGSMTESDLNHCTNDESSSLVETTNISKTGSSYTENLSDDINLNNFQDETTVSVNEKCVGSVSNSKLETSDGNSQFIDSSFSQSTQFECETRSNDCADNFSDSDDFGNFESVTVGNHNLNCVDSVAVHEVETNSNLQVVNDDSFGDFSEFSEPVIVDSISTRNEIYENDDRNVETTDEGPSLESNVTSSESEAASLDKTLCQRTSENKSEEHFARRGSHDSDNDDEFNDFSDFTQSKAVGSERDEEETDNLTCASHTISSQDGFEDIFPKGPETYDAKTEDLGQGVIWQQLCPLESSPALSFQWPNSRAHTKLLSALNIDSRNILFGPKWNAKIPRFAANLGSNPLQPVKASERPSAVSTTNSHPSDAVVQNEQETVPDAHFDWVGSGLTNPLDCGSHSALLDLEILSTFDSLPTDDVNCIAHRTTLQKAVEIGDSNSSKGPNKLDNLKVLSSEAEKIISQLPDMNFMKKTYIEVLISNKV